jgi:DNA-binding beta-propeller fold protein YncE/Leucine-rich repeat (LRR) protein
MKKLLLLSLLFSVSVSYAQFVTKTINDPGFTYRGTALDPAGDVNNDGFPDYIAGAWLDDATTNGNQGKAYIISGSDQSIIRTLVSPFPEIDGWFGYSVASGTDLNSDGKFDFVVGAPGETSGAFAKGGRVHVFSGSDGALLYTLNSPSAIANGQFGNAVLIQNDFDGVGGPEIVVSAYQENGQTAIAAGRVHVFNRNVFRNTIFSGAEEENGGFGWRLVSADDFLGIKALAVSAIFENPGTSPANSGVVHFYNMTSASSTFIRSIQDTAPTVFGNFGYSLASYINPANNKFELMVMDANNRLININTTGAQINSSSSFAANVTAGKFDRNNIPDFVTTSEVIYNSFNYKGGTGLNSSGNYLYDNGFGDAIMTLGDGDNDGANEIVAFSSNPGYITLNQLNSNLGGAPSGFERQDKTTATTLNVNPNSYFISIGDLDNDTKPELVVANNSSNTISVFRNTTTGSTVSYAPMIEFAVGTSPWAVSIVDLDGDSKADLAVTNANGTSFSVFRNTSSGAGNISFGAKVDYTTNASPTGITSADVDGDGKQDLAIASGSSIVSIYRNTSTGIGSINFAPKIDLNVIDNITSIAAGDLDGDGRPDGIITVGTGFVSVFRNSSTGAGVVSFEAKKDYATGANPQSVAIGDVDGDGKADIAVVSTDYSNTNTLSVYKNASSGVGNINYNAKVDFTTGKNPISVVLGNLDSDGKIDLVVANSNYTANSVSIFRNTRTSAGSISLASKEDYIVGSNPWSVAVGDLNNDNLPDIATANRGSSSVSILQNLDTPPSPTISFVNPVSGGYIGGTASIVGTNFSTNPANNIVKFNGKTAIVNASTSTQITTIVPSGATTGPVSLTIGTNTITSPGNFIILNAPVLTADSLALVALYNSTIGANWTNKNNWLTGQVGGWYGITVTGNRVTSIDLVNNNLTGTIPPQIGNLTALTQINIGTNSISGSIPKEIGNLTSLQFLRLYQNQLTGSIPAEVANLTSLRNLILFKNKLSGTIPSGIWNNTSIQNIFISDNQFTGTIPAAIGNLTNLFQFIISNNQFTGSLPPEIGNLSITGISVQVDHNQLSGTIPSTVGNMANLFYLDLSSNNFSGGIPSTFSNLSKLESLNVANNNFTDFPDLSALSTLTALNLENNLFTFEDIAPNKSIPGVVFSPQKKLPSSAALNLLNGQPATFTKTVGGTGNVYQWKKGTTNITGATTNAYSIAAVTPSDNAGYNLTITNPNVPGLTLLTEDFLLTVTSSLALEESGYQFYKALGAQAQGIVQVSTGRDVAFDSKGNLLVLEGNELVIKKFNTGGNLIGTIGGPGTNDGRFTILMSFALDAADNIYVVDFSLNRVQKFDTSGKFLIKWGASGGAPGNFNRPRGVAVDNSTGNVYVADTGNNRIQVFNASGVFQFSFGTVGSGNGQLNQPYKVVVTPAGQVLVADRGNNRVQFFTLAGVYVSQFGSVGSADGQFNGVNEMAVDTNGDILVCDQGNSRIQRFNSAGAFISKFGVNGINPGEFRGLEAIAIASNGDIVAGDINNGVQRYSNAGAYLSSSGDVGNSPGLVRSVVSIAVDSKGNRYLAEQNGARIQKFDKNGNSLLTFGTYGTGNGQFTVVQAVAVDRNDNIYVSDINQNRIQKFSPSGAFILSFGSNGSGDGQFSSPIAMAFDKANTLWVVDNGNKRVQQFTTSGVFKSKFGAAGTGVGQLNSPQGIAIEPSGNLFISENNPNRIQSFKTDGTYLSGITTSIGNAPGQLNSALGIFFDNLGKLYVSDRLNNRVQKIESDFGYLTKFGETGTGNGDFFNSPSFVLPNKAGDTLWISEFTNRVQIWTALSKQANSSDSLALVSIYNAMGGTAWTNKSNWLSGKMSTWHGVIESAGRVRGLNLKSNNLQGSIPAAVGNLTQLISLDLQGNKITSLPSEFGNLSFLQTLNLSNNLLTGAFPAFIPSLQNLTALKINGNSLTGTASLSTSTYIADIRNNKLDGLPILALTVDTLKVENNKFDFGDLEGNISIPSFTYAPQDSVGSASNQLKQVTQPIAYSNTIGGSNVVYQWNKNNAAIAGATSNSFIISSVKFGDEGNYRLEATSTLVPGLTLSSRNNILRVSSLTRDSIALKTLYDSTSGSGWTNKANWITKPLGTGNWFGVTVANNRVTQVNLPNNNLQGKVPVAFANVKDLVAADLSNNKINGLANVNSLPLITSFKVEKNQLQFSDLAPNATISGITYVPQDSVGAASNQLKQIGQAANYSTTVKGANVVYQWKKNNSNIGGATANSFSLPSVKFGDEGNYRLEATSTLVPGLTLSSRNNVLRLSSLVRDSIALKTLYDSTAGNGWTNKANWTTTPLGTGNWFGVTVANNRVTQVNLPNNNLQGKVPAAFANVKDMVTTDLSNNKISGLANVNALPLITSFKVEKNQLQFADLAPNTTISGITYVPQDSVGTASNQLKQIGQAANYSTTVKGANVVYQWKKNNSNIGGATANSFSLPSVKFGDEGNYRLEATSALVPGLTLSSRNNVLRLSSLVRDSIALKTLYDSTSGSGWTNKANWITTPLGTGNWFGVTVANNRVIQVNLPNNNLKGKVPAAFANVKDMVTADLSNNKISGLANLNSLPLITSLKVEKNQLQFADLEPNVSIPGITFVPQDSVGSKENVLKQLGEAQTFNAGVTGSANAYQWKKNNTNIAAATTASLTIPAITFGEDAVYRVEATSTKVPGLTLFGRTKTLRVSSLKRDSIALRALYNATSGANWTAKTNWLASPLGTGNWFGVTIANNRVTNLNLPNNNLTGSVPAVFSDLQNIKTVNLSGNKITKLPDLKPLASVTALDVSKNQLDFASLIPNAAITGINYSNQADIGTASTNLVDFGKDFPLKVSSRGVGNKYQWKRNGTAVVGATDSTYTIAAIGRSNMGTYVNEITNPAVPSLTLKTAPVTALAVATLSGKLFATAGNAANKGIMKLLKKTAVGGYDTTASKAINTDGTYKLEKIVLDDYQLNGFVDTLTYKGALPTWYTNTIFWEEANIIAVEGNVDNLNITSNYKPVSPPKGKGIIKGTIFDLDNSGRLDKQKRVAGCGASVRRVENVGRTEAEKLTLVAYVFSNENGEFTLPELPTGDYRLNIQYPGYPMDVNSFINITIGEGLKSSVVVAAEVDKGQIKVKKLVVTGDIDRDEYAADVFPNPSADYIQLRFDSPSEARTVCLTDLTGKVITLQPAPAVESKIDVTALSTGIYLLEIKEKDQVVKTLRVMKE